MSSSTTPLLEAQPAAAAPAAGAAGAPRLLQPWLHDLVAALAPPVQLWCGPSGAVGAVSSGGPAPAGAQGLWCGDVRVLSALVATVGGSAPTPVLASPDGADGQLVVSVARHLGDDAPDPTVRLEQHRRVTPDGLVEELVLASSARTPVTTEVTVHLAADLVAMDVVKGGRSAPPVAPEHDDAGVAWERDGVRARVTAPGAGVVVREAVTELTWRVELAPGERWTASWRVDARDDGAVVAAAPRAGWADQLAVASGDQRLARWVARSLEDLEALRMRTTGGAAGPMGDDVFMAAGAPWYFTLFGRDSLWAARMLLPLGTDLAASTLRVLAARQGVRDDAETGEEPGKILHEVRRAASEAEQAGGTAFLPPVYYGTVDATSLWVCLLHDAWRWGLPAEQVEPLLGHLEAALGWMARAADRGDGFLRYAGAGAGTGLANQGWKDSGDAVQWSDGRLAAGPIALCEVQGYAHEAALGAAALLDAFGRPGGEEWRAWAGDLAARFRERFWVEGALGRHVAIALDAEGAAVDSVTSNPGHLLGTGLLSPAESALVARRLVQPDLAEGRGLRTMSSLMAGYSPLSYHGGSVWTHDTAIAITGAARDGHDEAVAVLSAGLLDAAEAFGYRVPELHGGEARSGPGAVPAPVPYPASCRPQAWSAASAVAVLVALLGVHPDVPAGRLSVAPVPGAPFGSLRVGGLRVAGSPVQVAVEGGSVSVVGEGAEALTVTP
ncbi:glycogen debranching N-terminal domain-containing protein [Streptomyces sp. NP160]|uniref:amylo-alpha-1,6-glucosidase n=1 Tax=Streptomyces sp. NP160 TaxID=2586637 RepID=UPI001C5A4B04|nr:glycogen debranching N-terminal domain-containing protein [Streptomyces sp. NP160]